MLSETNRLLVFAILGGILPAFFWLYFWIKEDRLRPEPKAALISAFGGGILAVLLALFLELIVYYLLVDANPYSIKDFPEIIMGSLKKIADHYYLLDWQTAVWGKLQYFFYNSSTNILNNINVNRAVLVVIIAPIVEEFLKLILTYNICLRRKVNDEPIDAAIYMLTAALGFAAVETALNLNVDFIRNHVLKDTLAAENFRAIGPMLIHLISSATIGISLGLAFYKSRIKKILYLISGFILAVFFHASFNFIMIINYSTQNLIFLWIACAVTWTLVIILLLFFEKIKKITRQT